MVIELEVSWTYSVALPTNYPVTIYYRKVGSTAPYSTLLYNNGGGTGGTATITIYDNPTSDKITARDIECTVDYEGYVLPVCLVDSPANRTTFNTAEVDIGQYMACRGVEAICNSGAIIAVLPDQTSSALFDTNLIPTISLVSGVGDNTKLPTIDSVEFTNPSASQSTIYRILLDPASIDFSGGFNDTSTLISVNGFDASSNSVSMTPTIVTACGGGEYKECYTSTVRNMPYVGTGEIMKLCADNVGVNGYDDVYDNKLLPSIGDVTISTDYSCCQKSECRRIQLTWAGVPEMPWIEEFAGNVTGNETIPGVQYIDGTTLSTGGKSVAVNVAPPLGSPIWNAIPNTIYGRADLPNNINNYDWAAFIILGGFIFTDLGPCP